MPQNEFFSDLIINVRMGHIKLNNIKLYNPEMHFNVGICKNQTF